MAPRLKPLKDEKEIAAIPLSQPVLVEIAAPPTGREDGLQEPQSQPAPVVKEPDEERKDDSAAKLQKELETYKAADAAKQAEIDRERKRADEAQRQIRERDQQLVNERSHREQAVADNIASALSGAQAEQSSAEQEYVSAAQAQDPLAMAKAQGKIARAAAKVLNYEAASAEIEDRRQQAAAEAQRPRPQQQQQPVDIVTAVNTNPGLTQSEKDWLIKHQEVLVDRQRGVELEAAYIKATRDHKLHRGTDAYFQFLDKELGYAKAQAAEPEDDGNEGESTIMAAPVSRDNVSPSNGQTQSSSRVVLTPEMRDMARTMGVSDTAYAAQLLRLQQEKKNNPDKFRG